MTNETEAQEYPMWQKIDIFLSQEWDDKPLEWREEQADKAAYINDEKNRARAEKELKLKKN